MLPLKLNCPLVILDVESTGALIKVDRVVQIGLVKLYPDGRRSDWKTLVNPTIPIPPEATEEVHHITDEMVKDAPTFEALAPSLAKGFQGCDFAGFNVRFDLEMIAEEFRRVNAIPEHYLNGRILDAYRIFSHHEQRTLSAAALFYLGETHEGAHDALADVEMTERILAAQIERYSLPDNMEDLHRIFFETPRPGSLDPDSKLVMRHGEPTINFGKQHAGKALSQVDGDYLSWMMKGDFTPTVKRIIRAEIERRRRK